MSMKLSELRRLFRRTTLVPLNYGQPGCPELVVGDRLLAILENDSYDIIAGLCGMNGHTKAGYKVKWRVKKILDNGTVVIQSGSNRTLLNYLKWEDGNRVRCITFPLATTKLIRFFKVVRE
jgi:hypothetical protein